MLYYKTTKYIYNQSGSNPESVGLLERDLNVLIWFLIIRLPPLLANKHQMILSTCSLWTSELRLCSDFGVHVNWPHWRIASFYNQPENVVLGTSPLSASKLDFIFWNWRWKFGSVWNPENLLSKIQCCC